METLEVIDAQLTLWSRSVQKILAQLYSIMNSLEQRKALKEGKLGVLSQHHCHVTVLLEAKLVQSLERALGLINSEK